MSKAYRFLIHQSACPHAKHCAFQWHVDCLENGKQNVVCLVSEVPKCSNIERTNPTLCCCSMWRTRCSEIDPTNHLCAAAACDEMYWMPMQSCNVQCAIYCNSARQEMRFEVQSRIVCPVWCFQVSTRTLPTRLSVIGKSYRHHVSPKLIVETAERVLHIDDSGRAIAHRPVQAGLARSFCRTEGAQRGCTPCPLPA